VAAQSLERFRLRIMMAASFSFGSLHPISHFPTLGIRRQARGREDGSRQKRAGAARNVDS